MPLHLQSQLERHKRLLDLIDERRVAQQDSYIGWAVEARILKEHLDELERLPERGTPPPSLRLIAVLVAYIICCIASLWGIINRI